MKSFRSRLATFVATAVHVVTWVTCGIAHAQTASPAGSPSFDITPHHTGISVPNLEESVMWYQRMLGFEVVRA